MTTILLQEHTVHLANPDRVPPIRKFHGREEELRRCRAAWGLDSGSKMQCQELYRLHFRLQGPPGVGKNEIVYEMVRGLQRQQPDLQFYMIQGHEEMTPEDLNLLLVPDESVKDSHNPPLVLRASPLATAIITGGMFFFDEINRVPERALAPLASVLDDRQYLYSAMTGLRVEPQSDDARRRFRFCCALNPLFSESGKGGLPDYIGERTLPVIEIKPQPFDELCAILERNLSLPPDSGYLQEFRRRFAVQANQEMSVRKALSLMMYAINQAVPNGNIKEAFDAVEESILWDRPSRQDSPDERNG